MTSANGVNQPAVKHKQQLALVEPVPSTIAQVDPLINALELLVQHVLLSLVVVGVLRLTHVSLVPSVDQAQVLVIKAPGISVEQILAQIVEL